jgi:hypothetical protein
LPTALLVTVAVGVPLSQISTGDRKCIPSRIQISGDTPGTVLQTYDEAGQLLGEYTAPAR